MQLIVKISCTHVYTVEESDMFFFKKPQPIADTSDYIFLTDDGSCFYPLTCDPELYAKGLDLIRENIRKWMLQDHATCLTTGTPIENTIAYQIQQLDLKRLPEPNGILALSNILSDTEFSRSGGRLMDTVVRIYTFVPQEVLNAFSGKFLYGMLYALPPSINDVPLPTKSEWLELLQSWPWVPLLLIIQELYDNDEVYSRITAAIGKRAAAETTVATGDTVPEASQNPTTSNT